MDRPSRYSPTILLAISLGCIATGCQEDSKLVEHQLRFNMSRCLGDLQVDDNAETETCNRKTVTNAVYAGDGPNGCLTIRVNNDAKQTRTIRWSDDKLIVVDQSALKLRPDSRLSVQVSLFNQAITADDCSAHALGAECEGQCVVQLRAQPMSGSRGPIRIDFTNPNDGACTTRWNESGHPSLAERCDGLDNNCDGQIDELEQCCRTNADCQSDLSDMFCDGESWECVGCQSHADCSNKFDTRTFCDFESGRCGQCDPNPTSIASHRCPTDKPLCRLGEDGRTACDFCNPNAPIGDNGCPYQRPCFSDDDPASTPYCERCSTTDECPDGLECLRRLTETDTYNGSCRECAPNSSGENQACLARGTDAYCTDRGACVECLPEFEAFACPDNAPYCLPDGDGGFTCNPCTTDQDCRRVRSDAPFCVENRCVPCRPGTRQGCADSTPICGDDFLCRSCENDGECGEASVCVDAAAVSGCGTADTPCPTLGQCQDCALTDTGEMVQCTDELRPVCRSGSCSACDSDADCPEGKPVCNELGQCTECPTVLTRATMANLDTDTYRCDQFGPKSICSDDGVCEACTTDEQCAERPGDRTACIDGKCLGCRPGVAETGCTDGARPFCEPAMSRCVQCLEDVDCGGSLTCGDNVCVGACDHVFQGGCPPSAPVCRPDSTCDVCRIDDCIAERSTVQIRERCANSVSCLSCVSPPLNPPDEPMEIGGDDMNPDANEQSYGCDINSNTPLCSNGQCLACTADADCERVPGAGEFCDQDTGKCGVCRLGGAPARPALGCNEVVPICTNMDGGRNTCMECGDSSHCNRGRCVRGRCQVCNPETHDGCESEAPMCIFNAIEGRGYTCVTCREGTPESDAACRIRDCIERGLDPNSCSSAAQCVAGRCQACSVESTFCMDGRVCIEGECNPCSIDRDCFFRGMTDLGLVCDEGRCATKVMCRNREDSCRADDLYPGFDCVDGECGLCAMGTLCSDGTVCVRDFETRLPACQPCNRVGCPDGGFCNMARGTCSGGGMAGGDDRPQ